VLEEIHGAGAECPPQRTVCSKDGLRCHGRLVLGEVSEARDAGLEHPDLLCCLVKLSISVDSVCSACKRNRAASFGYPPFCSWVARKLSMIFAGAAGCRQGRSTLPFVNFLNIR